MTKVLMLDFDGVLNDFDWFKSDEYQQTKLKYPGNQLSRETNWDDVESRKAFCGVFGPRHLNPAAVKHLNEILWRTDCRVVISSTWRRMFTLDEIVEMLIERGLGPLWRPNFIGMTPILDQQVGPLFTAPVRGNEIQAWMESHGVKQNQMCILDDDADMVHLSPRLVRVMGLNAENTEAVIKMLTAD